MTQTVPDPYRVTAVPLGPDGETRRSRAQAALDKVWLGAAIVFVGGATIRFMRTFRHALDVPDFWVQIFPILGLIATGMALAAVATRWVWFGRRGPRPWVRALIVVAPVWAWMYLTTEAYPMGAGARNWARPWLLLVIACLATTFLIDLGRHALKRTDRQSE